MIGLIVDWQKGRFASDSNNVTRTPGQVFRYQNFFCEAQGSSYQAQRWCLASRPNIEYSDFRYLYSVALFDPAFLWAASVNLVGAGTV